MTPAEREAQRTVVAWLRRVLPGAIVHAVVNEQAGSSSDPYARARFGQARKKTGVVSGFPDLLILLPGGRCCMIEMKKPPRRSEATGHLLKGVLEDHQGKLHDSIRALGHKVEVATCVDTARTALHAMGVATREVAGQPMPQPVFRRQKPRLPADRVPF
jgi:hypothetical protein